MSLHKMFLRSLVLSLGTLVAWSSSSSLVVAQTHELLYEFEVPPQYPRGNLVRTADGTLYGTSIQGANNWGTLFKITPTGDLVVLHAFTWDDGAHPHGGVIQGTDGALYGTTTSGGTQGYGTIFKWTAAAGLETLHSFNFANGAHPYGRLAEGTDGTLYGTTWYGGSASRGTIYKWTAAGGLQTLHSFSGAGGAHPFAGVTIDMTGALYGTTVYTGDWSCCGTIYRWTTAGLETLHTFSGTDGAHPHGGVTLGTNGELFGTTNSGGSAQYYWWGYGTIYKWSATGLETLHAFVSYADGAYPQADLTLGADGALFGTTSNGGPSGYGTVFKRTGDGLTTLHSFSGNDGAYPHSPVLYTDGWLISTTTHGGTSNQWSGTVFKIATDGSGFQSLHDLNRQDVREPVGRVVVATDGTVFGTSWSGGTNNYGTLYSVKDGVQTTLHSFGWDDGANPSYHGGLTRASDGALYGTTVQGGANGAGTIFKWTSATGVQSIHSFVWSDGASPYGGVIEGANGTLYGTTVSGGQYGRGTIFKWTSAGIQTLHSFSPSEGAHPYGGLVLSDDGTLHGTLYCCGSNNYGAIFKWTEAGGLEILHDFSYNDGAYPQGGVILAADGALYGTTSNGGANGYGTLFKWSANGGLQTLHSFNYWVTGGHPYLSLVQNSDGMIYGVADGGPNNRQPGVVFRWTGTAFEQVHAFTFADGAWPSGGLVAAPDGNLYGVTWSGGSGGGGTLFRLLIVPPDTVAPSASPTHSPTANAAGWNNTDVTVTWNWADNAGGSGIDASNCTTTTTTSGEGNPLTVNANCNDLAGNTGAASYDVKIDKTVPTVSGAASSSPNGEGWYNADVTVAFTCDDALSGLSGPCPAAQTLSAEGTAVASSPQTVSDVAGNISAPSNVVSVRIDKTAPTINAAAATAPNAAGWYNGDVTVAFTCADTLSGVPTCPAAQVLNAEGAAVASAAQTVSDRAGNTSAASNVVIVKIDKTLPLVALTGGPSSAGTYYFGSVPAAPTCSASDPLSGLASCSVSGYSTLVGTHTVTATAKDLADNQNTASITYTVLPWTFGGFYQPVDMAGVWNIVKNGSTVPLKFEVFAGATELTDTTIVKSLTATQSPCSGGQADDIEVVATGGTSLRYDATAGQFIYNWQTPKRAGYCYSVTLTFGDGTAGSAKFQLK